MTDALLRWYATRDPREQRILRWAAVLVPVLLLSAVLLALHRTGTGLEQRVLTKQRDLAWMQAVAPVLAAAGPAPAGEAQQSVVQSIDHAISESGLSRFVVGATPDGSGRVSVQFENAPFNGLLAWAQGIALRRGLRVEAARVEAAAERGAVNASFTVRELP
jgi:type II secretory pathway component PulM